MREIKSITHLSDLDTSTSYGMAAWKDTQRKHLIQRLAHIKTPLNDGLQETPITGDLYMKSGTPG